MNFVLQATGSTEPRQVKIQQMHSTICLAICGKTMVQSLSKPSGVNPVFTEAAKEHAIVVKILPTSQHPYVET